MNDDKYAAPSSIACEGVARREILPAADGEAPIDGGDGTQPDTVTGDDLGSTTSPGTEQTI